ncbi:hypothetical protein U5817_06700 [Aromatoleum evansii]|uniref:Uncharacterized protein n=1 Tax=Aromatoleum evansii TaxID=59406 RepID=A0ABZ1APE1_AROEV|nr:hypothetical protein U5817_06700 [Aromatoleum evansii]
MTARTAELLQNHLASCREILDHLISVELADDLDALQGLYAGMRTGEVSLQLLSTFAPVPCVQGIVVDAGGNKLELFRIVVSPPVKSN